MSEVLTHTILTQTDPTRTTALRNAFARDMKRRFKELIKAIRVGVAENNAFGLSGTNVPGPFLFNQIQVPGTGAFAFPRSVDKIAAFIRWLEHQVEVGLLTTGEFDQIGIGIENAWTNKYILDSYKRGLIRARYEMKKAGANIPSIDETGGIDVSFGTPIHIDRLGVLYTRVFSELKGITAQMDQLISRILAQGIADGDNPRLLARKLVATIDGAGVGELGITDSLGRFIPAARRAEILARTEIIRAHHQGMIQEYMNWGMQGVTILAEWKTAGDHRVCERCEMHEGEIFTLEVAMNMIPLHPQCFIDPQIPIYTSKGWKPIGHIRIGDFVLTHKKRFQKVYATIRNKKQSPEVIRFKFKGYLHLSMTTNHPVFIYKSQLSFAEWADAGECSVGDLVMLLASRCKRCDKLIPYFRKYCSHTCLSLDITDRQWSNPKHRKNMSEKTSKQLKREYSLEIRDKTTITKAANDKTRQMVKDGTYGSWMNKEFFKRMKEFMNTEEHRKASSERMKKNNPMHNPIIVKKAQESIEKHLKANPEKRINVRMAKHRKSGKMTWIEKRMGVLLDKLGIDYVFQYPILRYNVDFAIPVLRIVIECDGEYWHRDKEKDEIRQQCIEEEGWFVLRYSGAKINQCLEEIEGELVRICKNHTGEYELIPWEIESIRKWKVQKRVTLYNLSVENDESYLAKGVVVHNCRCLALPYRKEWETIRDIIPANI